MTVKSALTTMVTCALEDGNGATWESLLASVCKIADDQHHPSCHYDQIMCGRPGKCPHPGLADLWRELTEAASDDGEAYISGDDVRKIAALAPQLFPDVAQRLLAASQIIRVPCECCGGRGYTEKRRS